MDARVENHGNLFLLHLLSPEARAWVDEHVQTESWQWAGEALAVDQHYIENLVDAMVADGLEVG